MAKSIISLECPQCHFPARAEVEKFHKYVIYVCPKCHSNAVFYNNKMGVLSDRMVRSLAKKKRLRVCGSASFPEALAKSVPDETPVRTSSEGITKDKIIDLKILLETEKDIDSFLSKL